MAYDEELAGRIRTLLGSEPGLEEKKIFGGLAFLIGGHMAVAANSRGGLLVRVDPEDSDDLVKTTPAYLMKMRRKTMRGWLQVDSAHLGSDGDLAAWVERGAAYARSLPAKG